jgi:purine catabolism regulator
MVCQVEDRPEQGIKHPAPGTLSVRELLDHDAMQGAQLAAGAGGLERRIARLNFMTVPDIVRWTKQDEFLLTTGYPLPRDAASFRALIDQLAQRGLAGIGIKLDQYLSEVPPAALAVADAADFPVVIIPSPNALDDVLSQAFATIVNRQARALEMSREIHDVLIGVALSGGSLLTLVDKLSSILHEATVVICDTAGNVLGATDNPGRLRKLGLQDAQGCLNVHVLRPGVHHDPESGLHWAVAVISAGAMRHGFVVAVEGSNWVPLIFGAAVEQSALVAALQVTKDLAVASVERQFASNALHDLVTSTPTEAADAVARAGTFGWDLDRPLAVLVAREEGGPPKEDRTARERELDGQRAIGLWTSAIRSRDHGAAAAGFATELVAIVGAADPEAFAFSVKAEMATASDRIYSIGVSRVGAAAADLPSLYQEARTALSVGRRLNGAGAVTGFAGLGLYRLLSSIGEEELRSFLDDTLGPVLALQSSSRADLLETLSALLENSFNVAQTARTLHYHYNTLRYRVSKLEALLGNFVDDAEASLRIGVGLQILRMYEISGDTGFPRLRRAAD